MVHKYPLHLALYIGSKAVISHFYIKSKKKKLSYKLVFESQNDFYPIYK